MPTLLRPILLLIAALAAVATACGGSGNGPKAGARVITIANFEFAPETLQARVGDTITVENKDSAEHTVTATDRSFDTGRFAASARTFTVTKAGRLEFVCDVHPFMKHAFIQVAG